MQEILQIALENEIEEFVQKHSNLTDEGGRKVVAKNGYMPESDIVTGIGPLPIIQPRIDNRNLKEHCNNERFTSNILPRYLCRLPSINNLICALYLKGISTNDFPTTPSTMLGECAEGRSAPNIVRLKESLAKRLHAVEKPGLKRQKLCIFLGKLKFILM